MFAGARPISELSLLIAARVQTLEREHSICAFRRQIDLVERTWNDDRPTLPGLKENSSGVHRVG